LKILSPVAFIERGRRFFEQRDVSGFVGGVDFAIAG
jgi:hypothetical protein